MSRFKYLLVPALLTLFSFGLQANTLKHIKLIATTNVSGETDPCG